MLARSIVRNFTTKSNILVVGGGQIGKSVALGLRRNGYENITVADPRPVNQAELEAAGITFVTSSKGRGGDADVLFTALPKPEHVRFVMEESALMDELRRDTIWIDHTSTDPDEAVRLSAKANNKGLKVVEAPLTGGLQLLKIGQMTVLAGGPAQLIDETKPLMRSYTDERRILRMGEYGAASVVKIITNMLAGAHQVLAGESVMLAKRHDVDLSAFFDGVRNSAGNSYVFETEVPLIYNGTYDPGFTIDLHCKDLNIGHVLSKRGNCPLPLFDLSENIYRKAMAKYGAEVGSSSPPRLLEDEYCEAMRCAGFDQWSYTVIPVGQSGNEDGMGVVHLGRSDK